MNKIFLDLEMNCSKEREIIEIGAVMVNFKNEIVSEFSSYVTPTTSVITERTTKLTGITQNHITHSPSLSVVLSHFLDWSGTSDYIIYSWSMTDYNQLHKETIKKNIIDSRLDYMFANWYDYQREFSNLINYDGQISLKNAINALDLQFQGKHHTALSDAQNTASLFFAANSNQEKYKLEIIKDLFTPKSISSTIGDLFPTLTYLTI